LDAAAAAAASTGGGGDGGRATPGSGGDGGALAAGGGAVSRPIRPASHCDSSGGGAGGGGGAAAGGGPDSAATLGGGRSGGGDAAAGVTLKLSDHVQERGGGDGADDDTTRAAAAAACALKSVRASVANVGALALAAAPAQRSDHVATTVLFTLLLLPPAAADGMAVKLNVRTGASAVKLARCSVTCPTARGASFSTFHWYRRHVTALRLLCASHTPMGRATAYDTPAAFTSGSAAQKEAFSAGCDAFAASATAVPGLQEM
jgi:hypothetical protein